MHHGVIITTYRPDIDPPALPYMQQQLIDSFKDWSAVTKVTLGVGVVKGEWEPVVLVEMEKPLTDMQKLKFIQLAKRYRQEYFVQIQFGVARRVPCQEEILGYFRKPMIGEAQANFTIDYSTNTKYIIDPLNCNANNC